MSGDHRKCLCDKRLLSLAWVQLRALTIGHDTQQALDAECQSADRSMTLLGIPTQSLLNPGTLSWTVTDMGERCKACDQLRE